MTIKCVEVFIIWLISIVGAAFEQEGTGEKRGGGGIFGSHR